MTRKGIWLAGTLVALAIAVVVLTGAQSNVSQNATIQDLLDLLITEEGGSRLALLEAEIGHMHEKLDLIHATAQQMLDEQYGIFEIEEWTLSDITFQLNQIETQLACISDVVCSP